MKSSRSKYLEATRFVSACHLHNSSFAAPTLAERTDLHVSSRLPPFGQNEFDRTERQMKLPLHFPLRRSN